MVSRPVWVALVLVAACSGKKGAAAHTSDPAAVSGPGRAGIAACQAAVRALDAIAACAPTPEEQALHRYLGKDVRASFTSTTPVTEPIAAVTRDCLAQLDQYDAALRWQHCTSPVTAGERAWVAATYQHRTVIPAAADAGSQPALQQVSELRERSCACKDVACVDAAMQAYLADMKTVSDGAAAVVRDAHRDILGEATRCEGRLRRDASFAEPPPPSDPEAAKRMLAEMKARDEGTP